MFHWGQNMLNSYGQIDYREPEWVAEKLGLDKNTVYKYLQDGTLPGVQLGRKWLVSERLLAEHLERETRRQTQLRAGANPDPEVEMRSAPRNAPKLPKTPRLKRALDYARELACRHSAGAVNTEHLVIALAEAEGGLASTVLRNLGVTAAKLREADTPPAAPAAITGGRIPASDEARHSFMLSVEQAVGLGHEYLGGEHVLLGILSNPDSGGSRMLRTLGVTYDTARAELMKHIQGRE